MSEMDQPELTISDLKAQYEAGERVFRGIRIKGHLDYIDLTDADLEGADFGEKRLKGVKLCGANLKGANFKRAWLIRSDLSGADISEADFTQAHVHSTLRGVRGRNVRFNDAWLGFQKDFVEYRQASDLSGADLRGASFRRARLKDVVFDGANLEGAVMPDGEKHGRRNRASHYTASPDRNSTRKHRRWDRKRRRRSRKGLRVKRRARRRR